MRNYSCAVMVVLAASAGWDAPLAAQAPVSTGYVFTTYAGQTTRRTTVDGAGTRARFRAPAGVAIDATGAVFVSDIDDHVIRRIAPAGEVTVWAGQPGISGEVNGHRSVALFQRLGAMVCDAAGRLVVVDGNTLRRIDTAGVVTTLAGVERLAGFSDGAGAGARLSQPFGLSAGPDGAVYFNDATESSGAQRRLRRVDPDGRVTTVLAAATVAPATGSFIGAVAADGNLLVWVSYSYSSSEVIRMTPSGGVITRNGTISHSLNPQDGIVVRPSGDLLLFDGSGVVLVSGRSVTPVFDTPGGGGASGALAPDGSLLVSLRYRAAVYRVTEQSSGNWSGVVFAGRDSQAPRTATDGPAGVATLAQPGGIALASDGTAFITDQDLHVVRRVAPDGTVTTLAGSAGASGNVDGQGGAARFHSPRGVALLSNGDLAVSDWGFGAGSIRRVTQEGAVTTMATGLSGPEGIVVDSTGTLYVADSNNHMIRRIDTNGVVTTLAGSGQQGSTNGPGTTARFGAPRGLAPGAGGILYVADTTNNAIRVVQPDGDVSTLVGEGLRYPTAISMMPDGNLLMFEAGQCLLRRVTTGGVVSTVAGVGPLGSATCEYGLTGGRIEGHSSVVVFGSESQVVAAADGSIVVVDDGSLRRGVAASSVRPEITTHPSSVRALVQQAASFAAGASGGATLQWQVSSDAGATWSAVADGPSYSGSQTVALTVSFAGLSQHGSLYRVVATNEFGTATSRPAQLTVDALTTRPGALRFAVLTDGALGPVSVVTPPQTLTVLVPSGASWTASSDQPWLQLSRTSGSGATALTLAIVDPGYPFGADGATERAGMVTLTPAVGPVVQVPVTLGVRVLLGSGYPTGYVDTPVQGATVRSSIGVTGWAVDDVGIAHVRIYRQCLPEEPEINCQYVRGRRVVLIGEAARVPGARFEDGRRYPEERSAGWGYLLLTNMLPRLSPFQPYGGQGTITLSVYVTDLEGQVSYIGGPTVTLDNDTLAKPFGALDTPGQGQTVSGTFPIFGWALTPDDGTGIVIPTDGSSMVVYIDGLPVRLVTYNQCRGTVGNPVPSGTYCNDDVANVFGTTSPQAPLTPRSSNPSGYRNLDVGRGAIGSYVLNTTGMANGLHSLAWSVTDSLGRVEGIGSRNFEVLNGGADAVAGSEDPASYASGGRAFRPGVASTRGVFAATGPTWVRRGFDAHAEWTLVGPGADGVLRTEVSVPGRVQVWVGGPIDAASLMVDGVAQPLPVGASLDGGVLTWAPAPGYLGDYRLSVVRGTQRTDIVITVRFEPLNP